jgi:hypothetical protein
MKANFVACLLLLTVVALQGAVAVRAIPKRAQQQSVDSRVLGTAPTACETAMRSAMSCVGPVLPSEGFSSSGCCSFVDGIISACSSGSVLDAITEILNLADVSENLGGSHSMEALLVLISSCPSTKFDRFPYVSLEFSLN